MKRYSYAIPTEGFSGTQKLFYIFDELGSVVAITNADGMPLKYYIYDPWGNITNTSSDPINNLTFVGRYGGLKDWDTGLIQFQHRWYDSSLGKWISRDPIGVEGGVNVYNYTGNNAVNRIDIDGLCKKDCFIDVFIPCIEKSFLEPLDMLVAIIFGGEAEITADIVKLAAIERAEILKVPNKSSIIKSLNMTARYLRTFSAGIELFLLNKTIISCLWIEIKALNEGECY